MVVSLLTNLFVSARWTGSSRRFCAVCTVLHVFLLSVFVNALLKGDQLRPHSQGIVSAASESEGSNDDYQGQMFPALVKL
jgi:hypothetical protein